MKELTIQILAMFDWFVLVYFIALNTSYLILIGAAAVTTIRTVSRADPNGRDDVFANPMTPAISILIPAFNEEACIVDSTRAVLALQYPEFEVIVIDDGSTDNTLERLRDAFDLVETAPALGDEIAHLGPVTTMLVPRSGRGQLIVVSKTNAGRRSDALNVGINASRHELVCCVDADSIMDRDALLHVARPFVDDPDRVIACGGSIRAVNGSDVVRGHLSAARQPTSWLARIQVVEYLRSFLIGRTGWSRLGCILIISGAFGLYRRDILVEVGGFDPDSLAEDADVIASMHRLMRDRGVPYRVVFLPDPVCWTEVPSTRSVLARQRRRWSHGLADLLWKQRRMIGNPRYGRIGVVVLPYFLVFELLGPFVELVGVAAVIGGLWFGAVSMDFALLFAATAMLYGIALSVASLLFEEIAFHKYSRWRDIGIGFVAAVVENIGFRQLHAWWRAQGVVAAIRGREAQWGVMTRSGFDVETDDQHAGKSLSRG